MHKSIKIWTSFSLAQYFMIRFAFLKTAKARQMLFVLVTKILQAHFWYNIHISEVIKESCNVTSSASRLTIFILLEHILSNFFSIHLQKMFLKVSPFCFHALNEVECYMVWLFSKVRMKGKAFQAVSFCRSL